MRVLSQSPPYENLINKLCQKTRKKLNAVPKITYYMAFNNRMVIMKACITPQFSYFSLLWMFLSKEMSKSDALHERTLRITNWEKESFFNELLQKNNCISIPHKNSRSLAMQISKMSDNMFHSVHNGTETLSHL